MVKRKNLHLFIFESFPDSIWLAATLFAGNVFDELQFMSNDALMTQVMAAFQLYSQPDLQAAVYYLLHNLVAESKYTEKCKELLLKYSFHKHLSELWQKG